MSLSTKEEEIPTVPITHVEWTVEEVSHIKELFKEEIHTGNISESIISDKLGASSLINNHSLKAIALKVKRLRSRYGDG